MKSTIFIIGLLCFDYFGAQYLRAREDTAFIRNIARAYTK